MLASLIITLMGGLSLAFLMLVISKIISDKLALAKFKKLSRGLPIIPNAKLIGNNWDILLGENICDRLRKLHDEHGSTVGGALGTRFCASTLDLDLIKTIILDEPEGHLNRAELDLPVEEFAKSIMLTSEHEWRHLRKAIAPALTSNKFKAPNVIQEIEASIGKLIAHIENKLDSKTEANDSFDVDELAHKYSLDLVFSCFYKQNNQIDFDDPNDTWSRLIEKSLNDLQTSPFVKLSLYFPVFRQFIDWLIWNFTVQGSGRKKILGFIKSQTNLGIEARKQLKELQKTNTRIDPNDFVLKDGRRFKRNMTDYIIDQFLDGKLSKDQFLNNTAFLLGAADRTASDCILYTIYLLSINQNVQNKLRASIKATGIESDYLDWVLKESLRLMPPAPIGCTRSIGRDIQLKDGSILPKDTLLFTNSYLIHRLKQYWGDDAEEFKPERWSDTSGHHPFQYLPFGAGLKRCPGKQFALFEMKMLFVALLGRYEFEGKPRADVDKFNTPIMIFVIPNSSTKVTIRRIQDESSKV